MTTPFTGYWGLYALCAICGIAVPIPEDIPLLYAGMLVERGSFALVPTLAVAIAGVLTRDLLVYGLGRFCGDWVLEFRWVHRVLPARKLTRARRLVASHGSIAVLTGRFLVGFRAPIFFVAGVAGIPFARFVGWDLLGMVVAVPTVIALGYVFGPPVVEFATWVIGQSTVVWTVLFIALLGLLWVRMGRAVDPA